MPSPGFEEMNPGLKVVWRGFAVRGDSPKPGHYAAVHQPIDPHYPASILPPSLIGLLRQLPKNGLPLYRQNKALLPQWQQQRQYNKQQVWFVFRVAEMLK